MKKLLIIDKCIDCHYLYKKKFEEFYMCSKAKIRIYNKYCIPAECTLKDASKIKNMKWLEEKEK